MPSAAARSAAEVIALAFTICATPAPSAPQLLKLYGAMRALHGKPGRAHGGPL